MSSIASTERFSVLVILRREYLDITGNFCAAKLIEYFRHWTKWKLKNHRTAWIYQPLKKIYLDLMGEHSLHVIRSAIARLEEMGIIEKQKNPGNGQDRTWQYKLNFDVLNKLLEKKQGSREIRSRGTNTLEDSKLEEEDLLPCSLPPAHLPLIERGRGKTEHCRFNAEQYHSYHPKASKPQQHSAVELEKSEEVKTEILGCDQESELPQITHFVENIEQDDSTSEIDTHVRVASRRESHSSADEVASNFQSGDSGDDDYTEPVDKSAQPSQQEVQEVLQQLREIPCTPQFRLNAEIQRTVKRYWANVPGAIAYLKEALRTWKGVKSPEAVFVAACKEGRKPEAQQVKSAVKDWFEWARKERIVGVA